MSPPVDVPPVPFRLDLRLSLANLRTLLSRSRSLWIFLMLAVALVIVARGVVAQGIASARQEILNSTIMRTVEVSSYGVQEPTPITDEWIDRFADLPNVEAVHPWLQAGTSIVDAPVAVPGALWATPRMPVGQPEIVASVRGGKGTALRDDEVVLPASAYGVNLHPLLGQTVTMEFTRKVSHGHGAAAHLKMRVVGLYDQAAGSRDGERGSAAYVDLHTARRMAAARHGVSPAAYGRSIGYPKVVVQARHADDVPALRRRIAAAGFNASSVRQQLSNLPGGLALIGILGTILTGLLALVALGGGLSVGANLVRARVRDIGLLKAIGYRNGRVVRIFGIELGVFGLSAGVLGLCVGLALDAAAGSGLAGREFLGVTMTEHVAMPAPGLAVLFAILPAAAIMLGAILPLYRAGRIPPDVALRDPYA